MERSRWAASLVCVLLVAVTAGCGDESGRPSIPAEFDVVVAQGRIIDPGSGTVIPRGYVAINGDKIAEVAKGGFDRLRATEYLDVQGATIMPGLIDAHVHLSALLSSTIIAGSPVEGRLRAWIDGGITSVLDTGSPPGAVDPLGKAIGQEGEDAPRVFFAGPILTTEGGYPDAIPVVSLVGQQVTTPDDGRAWVRRVVSEGARVVKLGIERGFGGRDDWPVLPLEIAAAIADEAHANSLDVIAHVTSPDEVRVAIDAGVDALAHTPSEALSDQMIAELVEKEIAIMSTLAVFPRSQAPSNLKRFSDAGGVVAAGTDFGCCGQAAGIEPLIKELELMSQAGISPEKILATVTAGGAKAANIEAEVGFIQPRHAADLIVVNGDPSKGLTALRNVVGVIKDGEIAVPKPDRK